MRLLFWLSVGLLAYTYVGYPILIALAGRIRPRPVRRRPIEPTVSLLITAHNEESAIGPKIENALRLQYPRDQLEIVVASDGSTDGTVEIARRYQAAGVQVRDFPVRGGKPSLLNEVIPDCTGEIVVLSDARQHYEPKALAALIRNFGDPIIGAVSGELILQRGSGTSFGWNVGLYWQYEKFLRRHESLFDSTIGTTGAIYAIRRHLFHPIPADTLLDDVLIPMQIARQGYRVVFESEAIATDLPAETPDEEFVRKVRTLAGNVQLILRQRWLWNPFQNRLLFQLVSHKLLRILVPFLSTAAFIANALIIDLGTFYLLAFAGQVSFYVAALGGILLTGRNKIPGIFGLPHAFCVLNLAAVIGVFRILSGSQAVTWRKASVKPSEPDQAPQGEAAVSATRRGSRP